AVAGVVAAGLGLWRLVGTGFLPEMDESAFVLDYFTPGGTALAETNREVGVAEGVLAATAEITGTSRRTGAELGMFATAQNSGDIIARLPPRSRRSRDVFAVIDDVRDRIAAAVPRLHIEFMQILADVINDLAGAARPVEVKLYGERLDTLEAYARRLAPALERIAGPEDHYNGGSDPAAGARRAKRLGGLATFEPAESRLSLEGENLQQMIAMTADVSGRSLGGVMGDVQRVLADERPPAGVRVALGGQYASQQEAFRGLLLVLGLAVVSVCAVMVVQFESFVEPLVVLLVAPVSFVGALFGLLPLALGIGTGSELQRPLALAVIGGLALSTPITLFAVPTLLVAIRGRDYVIPALRLEHQ